MIGLLLLGGIATAIIKRYMLFKHYAFVIGQIAYVTPPGMKTAGDYSIIYRYKVSDHEYSGNRNKYYCGHLSRSYLKDLLVGKEFPVAYSINDAGSSLILVTQKDAEQFKYNFPDSLAKYDSILTCK